jgi:hypothetical protein
MMPFQQPMKNPFNNPIGGKSAGGRPKRLGGKMVILQQPDTPDGFEMSNTTPEVLQQVQQNYMGGIMPPGLSSKRYDLGGVNDRRRRNISMGNAKQNQRSWT